MVRLHPEQEIAWWQELRGIAAQNDPIRFFRRYAEYLQAAGVISSNRAAIYNMSVAVANMERSPRDADFPIQSVHGAV